MGVPLHQFPNLDLNVLQHVPDPAGRKPQLQPALVEGHPLRPHPDHGHFPFRQDDQPRREVVAVRVELLGLGRCVVVHERPFRPLFFLNLTLGGTQHTPSDGWLDVGTELETPVGVELGCGAAARRPRVRQ